MYHVQPRTQTCLSAQAGSLQLQYALGECNVPWKVEFIEDMEEKRRALDIIMRHYTKDQFSYSDPAVRNVKVWESTCRSDDRKSFRSAGRRKAMRCTNLMESPAKSCIFMML